MTWRRLPTWFPNLRLQMLPLTPEQHEMLLNKGWLREVAFRCEPRTTKFEIKEFLQAVHGMEVERVNTINYQGKKKRNIDKHGKPHYYRQSDWKKAYVLFSPRAEEQEAWEDQRAEQQQQQLAELKAAALARSRRLPELLPAAAAAVSKAAAPTVLHNAELAMQRAAERQAARRAAELAARQAALQAAREAGQQEGGQQQQRRAGGKGQGSGGKGRSGRQR